jgi:hypothetical protein
MATVLRVRRLGGGGVVGWPQYWGGEGYEAGGAAAGQVGPDPGFIGDPYEPGTGGTGGSAGGGHEGEGCDNDHV